MYAFIIQHPGHDHAGISLVIAPDPESAMQFLKESLPGMFQLENDDWQKKFNHPRSDIVQRLDDPDEQDEYKIFRTVSFNTPSATMIDNGEWD